jgi:hypothetical protein
VGSALKNRQTYKTKGDFRHLIIARRGVLVLLLSSRGVVVIKQIGRSLTRTKGVLWKLAIDPLRETSVDAITLFRDLEMIFCVW